MKWDAKHDRAKKVLNHFLDNAGYWTETESLTEGLTEDEIQEVSAEVATMIQKHHKEIQTGRYASYRAGSQGRTGGRRESRGTGAEEPTEEVKEEKPTEKPKRRGRKPKKEEAA